ncbi:restriction endonuclease [Streptomyces lusitanus]|uniref:Restriction endonuclease n=1 Tax=Streptomyces lusitanus TaxID=68232 RepID=A0ABU3JL63_9ACTN|nr:restriction endonuclease [Streptomyces lusitanus]
MSNLRSDPRTSDAVRGSGWTSGSPQAEQLLSRLGAGERVELLFVTLRYQGALTARRLLLWRGTFRVQCVELSRPLPLVGTGSRSAFGETLVLDAPGGAIELKPLPPHVASALTAAGRSAAATPTAHHAAAAGRVSGTPRAEESVGVAGSYHPRVILTWQDAELAAVDHMRGLGFADARVTGAGADGGIDVFARDAVAQVKHYSQPIGVGPVRELRGVADPHQHLLFYASGGYTAAARQFADERKVALYSLAESGHVTPLNETATRLSARSAPAPSSGWSQASGWGRGAAAERASRRAAELDAQRQTVLRLIARVRAHTSEVHALPSNRYTKDRIKALKAAHKLTERAESLLARSRADFQTHGGRKQLIASADEKAREAALKLGLRV